MGNTTQEKAIPIKRLTATIGTKGAHIHYENNYNHPLSFGFTWDEYDHEQFHQGRALARLIINSPDMLRLLESNIEWMTQHGCVPPCHSEAVKLLDEMKKEDS